MLLHVNKWTVGWVNAWIDGRMGVEGTGTIMSRLGDGGKSCRSESYDRKYRVSCL